MQEIFKFCEVFEATKKDNLKKHDFHFYIGISLITILETILAEYIQLPL